MGKLLKQVFWVASSLDDLRDFPVSVREVFGFAIFVAQQGGKHQAAKPLKGFGGAGVLEVVEDDDGSTYRCVYTVKFAQCVYVLHAFQKKSTKGIKTSKTDLELIRQRLAAAKKHYEEG